MRAIEFNTGWSWKHLNAKGEGLPCTIPHDAMLGEKRTELSAGGINTGWYEGYDYKYTKRFTPDEALAAGTAVLEFEGVYHNAEVWLDGEKLAEASGSTQGQVSFTITPNGAKPWSPEHPRLYTCKVKFGSDEAVETFRLRTLSWGRDGLHGRGYGGLLGI